MLVIRKEQISTFSEVQVKRFEERVYKHLQKHWPNECDTLGEAAVRDSIKKGIERAKNYNIVSERDITRYINVMYTLGHDFDTDNRYPWAAQTLNAASLSSRAKMNQVCELTSTELRSMDNQTLVEKSDV